MRPLRLQPRLGRLLTPSRTGEVRLTRVFSVGCPVHEGGRRSPPWTRGGGRSTHWSARSTRRHAQGGPDALGQRVRRRSRLEDVAEVERDQIPPAALVPERDNVAAVNAARGVGRQPDDDRRKVTDPSPTHDSRAWEPSGCGRAGRQPHGLIRAGLPGSRPRIASSSAQRKRRRLTAEEDVTDVGGARAAVVERAEIAMGPWDHEIAAVQDPTVASRPTGGAERGYAAPADRVAEPAHPSRRPAERDASRRLPGRL